MYGSQPTNTVHNVKKSVKKCITYPWFTVISSEHFCLNWLDSAKNSFKII